MSHSMLMKGRARGARRVRARKAWRLGLLGVLVSELVHVPLSGFKQAGAAVDAPVSSSLPAQFDSSQFKSFGGIYASCMGVQGGLETIGNIAQGKNAPVSIMTQCSDGFSFNDARDMECRDLSSSGNLAATIDRMIAQNQTTLKDNVDCKLGKAQAALYEVQCLKEMNDKLKGEVNRMQGYVAQQIGANKKLLIEMNARITDKESQLQQIEQTLYGGPGGKGMAQVLEEAKQLSLAMEAETAQLKAQQDAIKRQRVALIEQKQTRKMALAAECMREKPISQVAPDLVKGGLVPRCEPNGPEVSFEQFVECRAEQDGLEVGGKVERNATTESVAARRRQDARSRLDRFFKDLPSDADLPASLEEAQKQSKRPSRIRTKSAARAKAENLFGSLGGKYKTLSKVVVEACYDEANEQVTAEEGMKNSALNQAQEAIKSTEQVMINNTNALIKKYTDVFDAGVGKMFNTTVATDVRGCIGANPDVQWTCVNGSEDGKRTGLKQEIDALLKGHGGRYALSKPIAAQYPENIETLQCLGLEKCVEAYQNKLKSVKAKAEAQKTARDKHKSDTEQALKTFLQSVGQSSQAGRAEIDRRLGALNAALASLGASPIQGSEVGCEEVRTDQDGMVEPPQNMLAAVSCSANLLDFSGNDFADMSGSMREVMEDLGRKKGDITHSNARLASMKTSCIAESLQAKAEKLEKHLPQWEECMAKQALCDGSGNPWERLAEAVEDVEEKSTGVPMSLDLSSLTTGIAGACARAGQRAGEHGGGDGDLTRAAESRKNRELARCREDHEHDVQEAVEYHSTCMVGVPVGDPTGEGRRCEAALNQAKGSARRTRDNCNRRAQDDFKEAVETASAERKRLAPTCRAVNQALERGLGAIGRDLDRYNGAAGEAY